MLQLIYISLIDVMGNLKLISVEYNEYILLVPINDMSYGYSKAQNIEYIQLTSNSNFPWHEWEEYELAATWKVTILRRIILFINSKI